MLQDMDVTISVMVGLVTGHTEYVMIFNRFLLGWVKG